jgi:hypothetical protein
MPPQVLPIGETVLSFPAGTINALVDQFYRDRAAEKAGSKDGRSSAGNRPWLIVQIKNSTDEQIEPGEVLGYSEPMLTLDDPPDGDPAQIHDAPMLDGVLATTAAHANQFAVVIDYIPVDGVGPAVVGGLAWVAVNWTDAAHDHIKVDDGEYMLTSSADGIKPIWHGDIPDELPALVSAIVNLSGSGSGADIDIKIALVDRDVDGVMEDDPADLLEADDIPLTDDEIAAGWEVLFQEPVPDDETNYTDNLVDNFNLLGYRRPPLMLKYYESDGTPHVGTAESDGGGTDTIELEHAASTVDDFYTGDTISTTGGAGSGQSKTITAYDGATFIATVDSDWGTAVDSSTEYSISSTLDSKLKTTTVDDTENKKRIVRFATLPFIYHGEAIKLGQYTQGDYPDYGENAPWPPPGVDDPETFFKKPRRWIAINSVLIVELCVELPPPILPESS